MSCIPLVDGKDKVCGYVCVPTVEREEKLRGIRRYCFGCKKRTIYARKVIYQMYYDPMVVEKCSVCGQDRRSMW